VVINPKKSVLTLEFRWCSKKWPGVRRDAKSWRLNKANTLSRNQKLRITRTSNAVFRLRLLRLYNGDLARVSALSCRIPDVL